VLSINRFQSGWMSKYGPITEREWLLLKTSVTSKLPALFFSQNGYGIMWCSSVLLAMPLYFNKSPN